MADLDLMSLGQRLGEAITPTPSNAPQVSYGTVAAVNADGTLDVELYGTTLRGLVATTGCVGAQAGMRCVVLRQGALATVVGLVASSSLGGIRLPNDGRIESTSAADPADWQNLIAWIGDTIHIGNGTYNQQTGKTSLYGNAVHIMSRDKRIYLNGGNYLNDHVTGAGTINTSYLNTTSSITFNKINGVVVCSWLLVPKSTTTTRTQVATIPAEFRPTQTIYAPFTTIASGEYALIYQSGSFQMNQLTANGSRWGAACWVANSDCSNAG